MVIKDVRKNVVKLLLINGLQVRVLPGSPLISPNYFYFHQFGRPPGVAAGAELSPTESKTPNKTPATRSTAFLCESETVWVYTLSVVSRSECPSNSWDVLSDAPLSCRSVW